MAPCVEPMPRQLPSTTSRPEAATLGTVILLVLVVVAGCVGGPADRDTAATTTPTTTTDTDLPTLTPADVHPNLTASLEIHHFTEATIHVTVVEVPTGRTVVDRTLRDDESVTDLDSAFRENGDYEVTIRVDGQVRWAETVDHFEGYELRVHENGSVSVESHSMA